MQSSLLDSNANKAVLLGLATAIAIPLVLQWLSKAKLSPKQQEKQLHQRYLDILDRKSNAFPDKCPVMTVFGPGIVQAFDESTLQYRVIVNGIVRQLTEGQIEAVRVKDIFIYPVKSCGGMRVSKARVLERGLEFDRQWLVMDGNNSFVTMRKYSKMALIQASVDLDDPSVLKLRAEGAKPLDVPILTSGDVRNVRVWKDHVDAVDQGDAAAAWFAEYLGEPSLRLVYFAPQSQRLCDPEFAEDYEMGFPDEFPIMLAASASLDDFQAKLQRPITMERFRPNIVVEGCPAWADDKWHDFKIGSLTCRNVKPCARCAMPSVDPSKGKRDDRALSSVQDVLRDHRNGKLLGFLDKKEREVFFGSHVVCDSRGSVSVGDIVKILTLQSQQD